MEKTEHIAVVGAGVAGLTAAWLLNRKYDVDIFEKNDYLGGHTRTFIVPDGPNAGTPVDMGFIVMNQRNYPVLTRIFDHLGIPRRNSNMSFSYHCEQTGYVYAGNNLKTLFAKKSNALRPGHWSMIRDILKFNKRAARDLLDGHLNGDTLGDYIDKQGYGKYFTERYLLAMGSAIWSSPHCEMKQFPAEPFIHFFYNHGLLSLKDRPQWQYVKDGSHSYVTRMRKDLGHGVFVNREVKSIRRTPDNVVLRFADGESQTYDRVVIGAHADEALKLLEDPSSLEQSLLGTWRYQENDAVLHTDTRVMPDVKSAWASWNFAREPGHADTNPVSVSYYMNQLQDLKTRESYMVTLNRSGRIDDRHVLDRVVFTHPMYTFDSLTTQDRLSELNGPLRTCFCGSYFGYGFHEDAARSGVQAAKALGVAW